MSLLLLCRYVDKDALKDIHEKSIEYSNIITQAYYEQDLGFMETKF